MFEYSFLGMLGSGLKMELLVDLTLLPDLLRLVSKYTYTHTHCHLFMTRTHFHFVLHILVVENMDIEGDFHTSWPSQLVHLLSISDVIRHPIALLASRSLYIILRDSEIARSHNKGVLSQSKLLGILVDLRAMLLSSKRFPRHFV